MPTETLQLAGLLLEAEAGDPVQTEIKRHGTHETWAWRAIEQALTPQSVFLDVGANIGAIALRAARICGKVYAIEAHPHNALLLQRNIAANMLTNVTLIPIAASDAVGSVDLFCRTHSSNGAIRKAASGGDYFLVPTAPLDNILRGLPPPNVVKMDIEGHEPKAVTGFMETIQRHRPMFVVEYSPIYTAAAGCGDGRAMLEALLQIGYMPSVLHRSGRVETLNSVAAVVTSAAEARNRGITHLDLLLTA